MDNSRQNEGIKSKQKLASIATSPLRFRRYFYRKKQRGMALIFVLMLLAMLAAIGATMSERLSMGFHRASNQQEYQQAYWNAMGLETLAVMGLQKTLANLKVISLNQQWAQPLEAYDMLFEGAEISGELRDLQACFNLNALQAETSSNSNQGLLNYLRNLLEELEINHNQAEAVVSATKDYIDADHHTTLPAGAENSLYMSMKPSYLAADNLLIDVSEWRAVYQVSAEVMKRTAGMVCALPTTDWKLNVNTITIEQAPLISALFYPNMSKENAVDLIKERPAKGWKKVNDFWNEPNVSMYKEKFQSRVGKYISVDSKYFELDALVKVQDAVIRLRSLLQGTNPKEVIVKRRRFGGLSERIFRRQTQQK